MNGATARWASLVPLSAYALWSIVAARPEIGFREFVVALVVALPVVEVGTRRLGAWAYLPGAGAALAFGLSEIGLVAGGIAPSLLVGLVVGAPAWWTGASKRVCESLTGSLWAALASVELALVVSAVARTSGTTPPGAWLGTAGQLLHDQWSSLVAFGQGATIPPAPFAVVPDAAFAVVALLPLVILVAGWLSPGVPSTTESGPRVDPARRDRPGHLGSLAVAVGAVLAFEAASLVTSPQVALVGLTVAVAELLVALAVASRWPTGEKAVPPTPISRPAPRPTGR